MLAENFERLFRTKITNAKAAAGATKSALGGSDDRYLAAKQNSHVTTRLSTHNGATQYVVGSA